MEQDDHQHVPIPRDLAGTQAHEVWAYLPAGVAQLDADYRLVWANATACRYLATLWTGSVGDPLLSLGGTPIQTLLAPRPGGPPREVVPADLPNRTLAIWAQSLPAANAGGWVLLIQDVTAERHLQRQQAQQERLTAMQRLVAGVANEFHHTLCSIMGYAELLQMQEACGPARQEDLGRIAAWGHRGLKMAHHMLDFSGQSVARLRLHDMQLILKKLLPHLEHTLPQTIHMVLDSTPGTYLINVDVALCLQLLLNLTLNARDAMPQGGELRWALSHFALHPDEPPPCLQMGHGAWVKLTVSDTGKGISPALRARLFDPFFTTRTGMRMGLGLTQAYSIMKQHNGYITVESAVGHGSVFSLYFPSWNPTIDATLEALPEAVPQGQGETLLVVDSVFSRREALRLTLRYLGYHVETAANGREALALCETHADAIDLVLSALVPTEHGGLALVRNLRQRHPDVKVIALVEAPLWSAWHDLLAQGANTCLRQPPDLPLLAQAVSQVLAVDD